MGKLTALIAIVDPTISIILLNMNVLSLLIKSQKLSDWTKKTRYNYLLLNNSLDSKRKPYYTNNHHKKGW